MTAAEELITQAKQLGASFELTATGVSVSRTQGPLPVDILAELRERKEDIRAVLAKQSHERVFPDPAQRHDELEELVRRVEGEGYVLLWSKVLEDLLAFHRDDIDPSSIPAGFVPYSDRALLELFGPDKPDLSPEPLRLIHAAKRTGARVTDNDPDQETDQ